MSDQKQTNVGRSAPLGVVATPLVNLQEMPIAAAWNLQGDASNASFLELAQSQFGVALPTMANGMRQGERVTAMWLGPTSWLLVAHDTVAPGHPLIDFNLRRDAVRAAHGALFEVSTSRIGWKITGPRTRELLASGCPLDFHPDVFAKNSCAQSVFGHVGALICRDTEGDFTLFVARSFARDVWSMLCESSAQYGFVAHAETSF